MDPYQPRQPRSSRRYKRKGTALFALVLLGCAVVFFTIIVIACSFVMNYTSDFQVSTYGGIEEAVQSSFHYTQYWAGIPYLVTGILVICSGTFQRNRELTITASVFCVISLTITLFVVSLDGYNWSYWDAQARVKNYWEGQSGIECVTENSVCVCKNMNANSTEVRSFKYECDEMGQVRSLYGAIVGSAILIALLCAFSLLTITKSLSWKRILGHRRRIYYDYDDLVVSNPRGNVVAMEVPRGPISRPPSFVDLPYTKRGEFVDAPVIAAQLPPRQFSHRSSNRGNRSY